MSGSFIITKSLLILSLLASFCGLESCTPERTDATLIVESSTSGSYEIYKENNDFSSHFTSQKLGSYNKPVRLEAASYILITKCSYKKIVLGKGEKKKIKVNSLFFFPPKEAQKEAHFLIECANYPKLFPKRTFEKTFDFKFFGDAAELKLNKKIFLTSFSELPLKEYKEKLVSLASLKVSAEISGLNSHYFITEKGRKTLLTQEEKLNFSRLLLPGKYLLDLNGTQKNITLKEGQNLNIETASFEIEKPKNFKENFSIKILGRPYKVHLNRKFRIFFAERIPVFEGEYSLNFEDSKDFRVFSLKANEHKKIKAKSIRVESNCPEKKWGCLGNKEVFFFSKKKKVFYQGKTDTPFLYFNEPVGAGFISSKGLIRWLPQGEKSVKMGTLILVPKKSYKQGLRHEFARLEAGSVKSTGFSQDIKIKKETKLDLVSGEYKLVVYLKTSEDEKDKRKIVYKIQLKDFETKILKFPYYVSEKKYLAASSASET